MTCTVTSSWVMGNVEPAPVIGHLGGGESIVKPA